MLTLDPDSNRQFIIIRTHQDIAVCTTELNEHGQLICQTTAEFDSQNRLRGFFCYTAAAGRITACRIYHYHTLRPSHKKTVLPTIATPATASGCCATPTLTASTHKPPAAIGLMPKAN